MRKKILSVVLGLAVSSSAWSQTHSIKKDTVVKSSDDKYKIVTNRFFDNWFIGAGAGTQLFFADHNKQMKFSDRLSPAYEFYIGKWVSPNIGLRAGVNGLKIVGVNQNGNHGTGVDYDPSQGLKKMEFQYVNIHADILFNLINIFSGYKEDRFYNLSPYAGVGWMYTWERPVAKEISANIGIFNSFRLNKIFDLTLDVRGSMVNERFGGTVGNRGQDGLLTGSVGIVYKFNKRNWERATTTIISYDEVELNALSHKVNTLAIDNAALKQQLTEAKNAAITDIKVENRMLVAPVLVTFEINKSVIGNDVRVNLGFLAKVIKEGNQNIIYNIKGYADKGTGSDITNKRLSRERAEAVYNVLVRECGVLPSQLKTTYEGGTENMFYNDPKLSRAVITIAEYK